MNISIEHKCHVWACLQEIKTWTKRNKSILFYISPVNLAEISRNNSSRFNGGSPQLWVDAVRFDIWKEKLESFHTKVAEALRHLLCNQGVGGSNFWAAALASNLPTVIGVVLPGHCRGGSYRFQSWGRLGTSVLLRMRGAGRRSWSGTRCPGGRWGHAGQTGSGPSWSAFSGKTKIRGKKTIRREIIREKKFEPEIK